SCCEMPSEGLGGTNTSTTAIRSVPEAAGAITESILLFCPRFPMLLHLSHLFHRPDNRENPPPATLRLRLLIREEDIRATHASSSGRSMSLLIRISSKSSSCPTRRST